MKRAAIRLSLVVAALHGAALAADARADITPPNLRSCEGAREGQPCETDACTPGTCTTTPGLLCKSTPPECLECLLLMRDGGTSCEADCTTTRAPCFLCIPSDRALDAKSRTYRWSDCSGKRAGDSCKTAACGDGTCELPACDEPPCPPTGADLVCTPPRPSAPSKRLALGVVGGLVLLLGALAAARVRGRRRRR